MDDWGSNIRIGDIVQVFMPKDLQRFWPEWRDPMIGIVVEIDGPLPVHTEKSVPFFHVAMSSGVHVFRANQLILIHGANQ